MIILAIRTDKPVAELGLYDDQKQIAYTKWQADRQLADTILKRIEEILNKSSISLQQVQGIVVFKGPGSFTGLRIGFTVANSLVYAQNIPIVAKSGENWIEDGISALKAGKDDKITTPEYGASAKTTLPKS